MIVHPEFFTHWKTQMLCALLEDKSAALYVLNLWAHCQTRKTDRIEAKKAHKLKGICRAEAHDPQKFASAMIECEFLDVEDEYWIVHDWSEVNKRIVSCQQNGGLGGRKSKTENKPTGNPAGTHGKPSRNPRGTQPEPTGTQSDQRGTHGEPSPREIRYDMNREEEEEEPAQGAGASSASSSASSSADSVSEIPDTFSLPGVEELGELKGCVAAVVGLNPKWGEGRKVQVIENALKGCSASVRAKAVHDFLSENVVQGSTKDVFPRNWFRQFMERAERERRKSVLDGEAIEGPLKYGGM